MKNKNKNLDPQNILEVIKNLPTQILIAQNSPKIKLQSPHLFIGAMGGSAFPVDILRAFLDETKHNQKLQTGLVRDYNIPTGLTADYCGIFISYSGNTAETISLLHQAEKKKLKQIIIIAHDGELTEIAKKKNYPLIQIPDYVQPRLAYGFIFGALLKLLTDNNLISFPAEKINRHIKNLNKTVATTELIARELAKKLIGNIPIIYSTAKWQTISKIWKINFNENSKIPSFYNIFPELCHNELVGFTQPLTKFTTIILKDNSDHLENQKRMLAFAEVMKKSAHPIIIDIPEGSIIEKIMQMLLLGSLTSYYLALEYKINPAPVKMVETFKKLL